MGGDGLAFFDIIFFALVAGFLILRLRSVLGRRTGNENQERWTPRLPPRGGPTAPGASDRAPSDRAPSDRAMADKVTVLPTRPAPSAGLSATPLDAALAQIRQADSNFDPNGFIEGAKSAFDMIVGAYAQGDTATLRPLLANDVFENFSGAIKGRHDAKQTLETTLIGIKSADILEARMESRSAFVTVKFVSEQVNVTRNASGEIVDGDPNHVATITDVWTFARNTRSSDPNWALVQTSEAH